MSAREEAVRTFSAHDQHAFAELTGDRNPMHVDAQSARRTQAGDIVVHGIHALLWALDVLAQHGAVPSDANGLKIQFRRFLYLEVPVALQLQRESAREVRAELIADGVVATAIAITRGAIRAADERPDPAAGQPVPEAPMVRYLEDCRAIAGAIDRGDRDIAARFPHASSRFGADRIHAIAMLSPLVGMVCPGLHSIFSGFTLRLEEPISVPLSYRVRTVDERFSFLAIDFAGKGVAGTVDAFVRQPPVEQPSLADVQPHVVPRSFAGTTALIVGGSRGLGALTARILAAGGARVIVTYLVGSHEARELVEEIGADCAQALPLDVRRPLGRDFLDALRWPVNQVYYFASTQIYRQKADWYVASRFRESCEIYVDGFERTVRSLHARCPSLKAFYPSSTALDERPRDMTEYAMAKAAGEVLCADMNRFLPGAGIVVTRLPRVLTDQTATVIPVESANAVSVSLEAVRAMHT